jgi:hypothetical protein
MEEVEARREQYGIAAGNTATKRAIFEGAPENKMTEKMAQKPRKDHLKKPKNFGNYAEAPF